VHVFEFLTQTQQKTDDQHGPNKKQMTNTNPTKENVLELMSSRIVSSYYFLLDIRYEK
jgi:hypothetical protein